MKKSDKLLLGGFLTLLLLITAIHVTLYAKYNSGHYTSYTDAAEADELLQPFPHILFISMINIPDASVHFGDMAQVEKTKAARLTCVQNGDTLTITGNGGVPQGDIRYPAIISVPYQAKLKISNSSVTFRSSTNPDQIKPVILLQHSQARFGGRERSDQFGQVKINASDSSVLFFNKSGFANLDVELSRSFMEETNASFGELSIVSDAASRISLQSKHLVKAKIKVNGSE